MLQTESIVLMTFPAKSWVFPGRQPLVPPGLYCCQISCFFSTFPNSNPCKIFTFIAQSGNLSSEIEKGGIAESLNPSKFILMMILKRKC